VPRVARGARPAEILVDDVDALARPAEPDGPLDQAVLQLRALLVLAYLLDRRLAHVDVGELGAVRRRRRLSGRRGAQHAHSPSPGSSGAADAAGRPAAGQPALASRLAGLATAATAVTPCAVGSTTDGAWSAWGTSTADTARLVARWRANGSSVRALMRDATGVALDVVAASPVRSVADRRRDRRRPSTSSTTI